MFFRKGNKVKLKVLRSDRIRVSKCDKTECANYDKHSETNCVLKFKDAVKCIHGEESQYE